MLACGATLAWADGGVPGGMLCVMSCAPCDPGTPTSSHRSEELWSGEPGEPSATSFKQLFEKVSDLLGITSVPAAGGLIR
jgi:hypothetical protein